MSQLHSRESDVAQLERLADELDARVGWMMCGMTRSWVRQVLREKAVAIRSRLLLQPNDVGDGISIAEGSK